MAQTFDIHKKNRISIYRI